MVWYEPSTQAVEYINENGHRFPREEKIFLRPELTLEQGHTYCEVIIATDEYGRDWAYPDVPIEYNKETGCWETFSSISLDTDPAHWTY